MLYVFDPLIPEKDENPVDGLAPEKTKVAPLAKPGAGVKPLIAPATPEEDAVISVPAEPSEKVLLVLEACTKNV